MYDYLIVGSGFAGATIAERIASELNKKVLIIDKRFHTGGNCYDYIDDSDNLVSKYGAHIFHTNGQNIWNFISQFAEFNSYLHKVYALFNGDLYTLPINLKTINRYFKLNLSEKEAFKFLEGKKIPISQPKNAEEAVISKIGIELYKSFYKNYTQKQWGMNPTELDSSVTMRLPIRYNEDERYFSDRWQGIPINGYTSIFERMLSHKNIKLLLNVEFSEVIGTVKFNNLIYTGRIDEYFGFLHGKLPYRSIDIKFENIKKEYFQDYAVINYPNENRYTRIVEYKHMTFQKNSFTTISKEYPCWNDSEPYYPVPSAANREIYQKYKLESAKLNNVFFTGRLGSYRYYNMDQVIGEALALFPRIVN